MPAAFQRDVISTGGRGARTLRRPRGFSVVCAWHHSCSIAADIMPTTRATVRPRPVRAAAVAPTGNAKPRRAGSRRWRVAIAVLATMGLPSSGRASLGGDEASIVSDQVRLQGAVMRVVPAGDYTVHEIQSAAGVTIREYASTSGRVFAVAWEGPYQPDLGQILGTYYARFQQQAERIERPRRSRGVLLIADADFVVQMSGHQRAFAGRAYLPGSLPRGVSAAAIR